MILRRERMNGRSSVKSMRRCQKRSLVPPPGPSSGNDLKLRLTSKFLGAEFHCKRYGGLNGSTGSASREDRCVAPFGSQHSGQHTKQSAGSDPQRAASVRLGPNSVASGVRPLLLCETASRSRCRWINHFLHRCNLRRWKAANLSVLANDRLVLG